MESELKRILGMLNNYRLEHGCDPGRITVSSEVARELEVEYDLMRNPFGQDLALPKTRPVLRRGTVMYIQNVLVVADLEPEYIMDVR